MQHYTIRTVTIRLIVVFTLFFGTSLPTAAQTFNRGIDQTAFIPKGQWLLGGSFSYSENTNSDFKWLVLNDITAQGYTFKLSPYFAYFIRDNIGLGARLGYSRSYTEINSLNLDLGDDLSFGINDYANVQHTFNAAFFARTYINLGESKRFGLYSEMRAGIGIGRGKNSSGTGATQTGTFQRITEFQLGFSPGMTVFVNNFAAVDVSIGVMGFDFKWIDQTTNQVEHSHRRESKGNFKIDIFSISIGMSFYM